ncbi:glutamine amidotransferase-like class 1 domain-containing protein 3A, mitochondrial [Ceratina calcarata]|uniref:Glutamine amidotransferase-like class 1 domain-containing protein 3A, mitochondrial n=1 Tax=Ceratina calcarata TaxID=156304 RepID=A0AAJ7N672_9HYME|nr:glutamine amidotransferase-like class 1 domain-containing protein 3A, mitochondrial [Ceratina calcarata]XP_017878850.2 glutamine amidotransferase-like class 1 domain-containing protein 3A, mitochondrial [Ceratina calcarata]
MLRTRIIRILQNEYFTTGHIVSSSIHTSQIVSRKCKKEREKMCEPISVAVILCGCGYKDGTEISEAISAAIHISQKDMKPSFFAPDVDICETIDHLTKEPDMNCSTRNALVEAARLARSKIKPLCECDSCRHAALVIPGGMGAAKILSNFAESGADCTVHPDLEKIIEEFYCDKKPIASMCIASAIVARVLKGVKVTLGKDSPKEDWPHAEAIKKVKQMGAKVELKGVKGVTKCKKYNVFSTPAWLYKPATYADVHNGIGKLITALRKSMNF